MTCKIVRESCAAFDAKQKAAEPLGHKGLAALVNRVKSQ